MAERFFPTPGAVATCRDRQWVVLPSEIPDVIRLRPLSGNEDQVCGIYQPLELEPMTSAQFPIPQADTIQDHTAAQLLMDATRLSLRSGAGPFRCRASFLTHWPDLVIVDEAHTCARPGGRSASHQQRYQLLQELAQREQQHLILRWIC